MNFVYIFNILCGVTCVVFSKKFLHIFQLRDYNAKRYFSYFSFKFYIFEVVCVALFVVQILIFKFISNIYLLLSLFILPGALCLVLYMLISKQIGSNKKTPIRFTPRLKRIYVLNTILLILPCFFKKYAILSVFLSVFNPIFANFLNFYDKFKNLGFIKSAQKKLKSSRAKIIAITGSNGKTSVKNIILKMLKYQFKVVASPSSYNTPLGLSKFINETNLDVDFVVLEYGARHKHDIEKLCKTFGADFGIIVSIAPQHLQTFKTIKNVVFAKTALSKFLNLKPCIFNIDNQFLREAFLEKRGEKFSVSLAPPADIFASEICQENFTTKFTLNAYGEKIICHTKLLGKHNITNIMLASALALKLGINFENLKQAIASLEFTPHRLEYIKGAVNILDDSYNCSLLSASNSLEVLSQCSGKKMVVTPGIVEGGKEQYRLNFELGKMLKNFDYVIFVGNENLAALKQGIEFEKPSSVISPTQPRGTQNPTLNKEVKQQNHAQDKILSEKENETQQQTFQTANHNANGNKKVFFAPTLEEAKKHFKLLSPDDTILLLNDLPDDYA